MLDIRTHGKGTYEVTDEVSGVVKRSGVLSGTATVFIQHTSASLIIYENADRSGAGGFGTLFRPGVAQP